MQLKKGASLVGTQWQMFDALIRIEPIFKRRGVELVITSGTDGKHGLGGKKELHSKGYADDVRSRDFKKIEVVLLVEAEIRVVLHKAYDIVLEKDHIHIEFDPKGSEHIDFLLTQGVRS